VRSGVDDPILNADDKLAIRRLVDGRGALLEYFDRREQLLGRLVDHLTLAKQLEPLRSALTQTCANRISRDLRCSLRTDWERFSAAWAAVKLPSSTIAQKQRNSFKSTS